MVTHARNKLFTPVQVGAVTLKHRVVMPPMSRLRAEWPSGVPSDSMLEYYSQRASDGGLIFTEATAICAIRARLQGRAGDLQQRAGGGLEAHHGCSPRQRRATCSFSSGTRAARHISRSRARSLSRLLSIRAYWADPSILVVTPDGFSQPSPHGRWKRLRSPASSSNTVPPRSTRRRRASTASSSWPPTAI